MELDNQEDDNPEHDNLGNEYGNIIDPITLDIIPLERLIKVKDGQCVTHFDLESLAANFEMNGNYRNPLTRQSFSQEVIGKIKEYMSEGDYIMCNMDDRLAIPPDTMLYKIPSMIMNKFYNKYRIRDYDVRFRIDGTTMSIYTLNLKSRIDEYDPDKITIGMFRSPGERLNKLLRLVNTLDDVNPDIADEISGLFERWIDVDNNDKYSLKRVNTLRVAAQIMSASQVPPTNELYTTDNQVICEVMSPVTSPHQALRDEIERCRQVGYAVGQQLLHSPLGIQHQRLTDDSIEDKTVSSSGNSQQMSMSDSWGWGLLEMSEDELTPQPQSRLPQTLILHPLMTPPSDVIYSLSESSSDFQDMAHPCNIQ